MKIQPATAQMTREEMMTLEGIGREVGGLCTQLGLHETCDCDRCPFTLFCYATPKNWREHLGMFDATFAVID